MKHELAVAFGITSTKTADSDALPDLLAHARANLPQDRIQTLACDNAADTNAIHELLHEAEIKPVVQLRSLWQNEK